KCAAAQHKLHVCRRSFWASPDSLHNRRRPHRVRCQCHRRRCHLQGIARKLPHSQCWRIVICVPPWPHIALATLCGKGGTSHCPHPKTGKIVLETAHVVLHDAGPVSIVVHGGLAGIDQIVRQI